LPKVIRALEEQNPRTRVAKQPRNLMTHSRCLRPTRVGDQDDIRHVAIVAAGPRPVAIDPARLPRRTTGTQRTRGQSKHGDDYGDRTLVRWRCTSRPIPGFRNEFMLRNVTE
jgi:hypothetical protein